jgi:aminoglycoside phosphotransferase (APT) family kinase protein
MLRAMQLQHDLPAGIVAWIEELAGGEITRLARHVARREAWVVDATRHDGSLLEGFLRLERDPQPGNPWSLAKETRIVAALGRTSVPVPRVYGRSDALGCTLFERVPGRSDLDRLPDAGAQRAVLEHFIECLAALHRLDPDALGLDDALPPRPTTPQQAALGELELLVAKWSRFLSRYVEPLLTFGIDWLGRNAPQRLARVSLVQGDTGPGNFVFEGGRVRAVVDWEWGHWGDPLEDLGNLCVREFWNPCGGLEGLFRLYEARSGIPYQRGAALYYRVQQNVRGMIPIHHVTANAHPRESLAWYLAYRYVGDRATCESLVDAMGIGAGPVELPDEGRGEPDVLALAAQYALERDVAPSLGDDFARSRANDARILLEVIERRRRYGAALERLEREDQGALLGRRPRSVAAGLAALDRAIRARTLSDEAVAAYLLRRALRDEWLHAPAVALYPERRWSKID